MAFNHENLKVYGRSLNFNSKVSHWISEWDPKHAICDQMDRAAASVVENIAMGSAANRALKIRYLDYAVGSTLECAACLDLAGIKHLLQEQDVVSEKMELIQILSMLIGLRKAWSVAMVREAEEGDGRPASRAFHHETLDVYRVALDVARCFSVPGTPDMISRSVFCRLDEPLTSMVLNIAEGNGRFSLPDQRRFMTTAHEAAIKLAARLDLCRIQRIVPVADLESCKCLLERVSAMTLPMSSGG